MTSSDNLMAMDNHSWMFRNSCLDTWLPETFFRETESFTKAIHKSFDTQDFHNMNLSTEFMSPWLNDTAQVLTQTSTHTPTGSCGSPENELSVRDDLTPLLGELKRPLIVNNDVPTVGSVKRSNGGGDGGGGKMKKRRSRASKRSTTTFINADAANFRQLVQEITGVKFGGGNGLFSVGGGGGAQLLKPQPHRVANSLQLIGGGGGLVTLDTSSSFMDPTHQNNQDKVVFDHQVGGGAPSSAVVEGGGAVATSGFEFDSFCNFPTLESWKAI